MIKELLSTLLVMPLFFSSRAVSSTKALEEGHNHNFSGGVCECGACDGTHPSGWTAWSTTNSLPSTTGKYYLTADVSLTAAWTISGKDITLCLNDHVVNLGEKKNFVLTNSAKLTIYDCGTTARFYDKDSTTGLWTLKASGSSDYTTNGGIITGGVSQTGGAISVASGCILTLNGGNIVGNNAKNFSSTGSIGGGGVFSKGTITMNGGNIIGNAVIDYSNGGAICAFDGTLVMNGGCISNNTARNGGGIITYTGEFTLNDGKITENVSTEYGGGVYTCDTFNMNGGKISNNTSTLNGGGVYSMGNFTMTDGEISGNKTIDKSAKGGGIYQDLYTFKMSGGVIKDNATSGAGGGVFVNGGSFEMSAGKITGNSSVNGAGVYNAKTFTMTGGEISGNNATYKAGGVYGNGTVLIGGAAKVINNTVTTTTTTTTNNCFVYNGKFITIGTKTATDDGNGVEAPTSEFKVGVNMDKAGKFTSNGTEDDVKYFTADIEDYQVKYNTDGYLELAALPLPSPVMNPTSGYATSVTLTAEEGTIYYTTNGSEPTASSTKYMGSPIPVTSDNFVIKAIAIDTVNSRKSEVVTGIFTNVIKCTVNINAVNGTVDVEELTNIVFDTAYSINANKLTIGDTEITATADEGFEFNCWKIGDTPAAASGSIRSNVTFTAVFSDHDLVKVDGTPATEDHDGFKDAFKCNLCGKYFEDAEGTKLIGDEAAYNAWKLAEGKIPALNPQKENGLSGGAVAGIVIGIIFGLLIIVFAVLYILWKRKNFNVPFLCKVLTPAFRFINKLFFKTKLNNVEAKDAEDRGMDEETYLKALKDKSLMESDK